MYLRCCAPIRHLSGAWNPWCSGCYLAGVNCWRPSRKTEATMPEQSSMHFYLNWAKERLDEMDATLAALEAKAGQVKADSKIKANQLREDLQKRRDEFQATVKKQAQAGEAVWERTKSQLESNWNDFEARVKTYI